MPFFFSRFDGMILKKGEDSHQPFKPNPGAKLAPKKNHLDSPLKIGPVDQFRRGLEPATP